MCVLSELGFKNEILGAEKNNFLSVDGGWSRRRPVLPWLVSREINIIYHPWLVSREINIIWLVSMEINIIYHPWLVSREINYHPWLVSREIIFISNDTHTSCQSWLVSKGSQCQQASLVSQGNHKIEKYVVRRTKVAGGVSHIWTYVIFIDAIFQRTWIDLRENTV
jgi:hypothetical protein